MTSKVYACPLLAPISKPKSAIFILGNPNIDCKNTILMFNFQDVIILIIKCGYMEKYCF
jgi:hypothetical protein